MRILGSLLRSRSRPLFYVVLAVLLLLLMFLFPSNLFSDTPTPEPDGTLAILQPEGKLVILQPEKIELKLPDVAKPADEAKPEAVTLTMHNLSARPVDLGFCMLLEANDLCEAVFEFVDTSGTYRIALNPGSQELKLDAGQYRTYQLQFSATYPGTTWVREKALSGFLVVQTKDASDSVSTYIPLTITAKEPSHLLTTCLSGNAGHVVWIALVLSALVGIYAALRALRQERIDHLRFSLRRREPTDNPIFRLRMGIAKWKLDESWASTLVVLVGVFAALSDVLPEESTVLTAHTWKAYSLIFAVMTGIAAFLYNATTRPGPEEATEDKSNKEGYVWVWVLAAVVLTGWSLLGQLGMGAFLLEALRADPETLIPNGLINLLEIALLLLFVFALAYIGSAVGKALRAQKLDGQTPELVPQKEYKKTLDEIKTTIDTYRKLNTSLPLDNGRSLSIALVLHLQGLQETLESDDFQCVEPLAPGAGLASSKNEIVSYLSQLFFCNLVAKLKDLASKHGTDKAKLWEEAKKLLGDINEDADKALELVKRRKKPKVVATAFFTSLGAPCSERERIYQETYDEIIHRIGIAKAQATEQETELATILDIDQHFTPGITSTLENLDSELGGTGKDPFHNALDEVLVKTGIKDLKAARTRWDLKFRLDNLQPKVLDAYNNAKKDCESCKVPLLAELRETTEQLLAKLHRPKVALGFRTDDYMGTSLASLDQATAVALGRLKLAQEENADVDILGEQAEADILVKQAEVDRLVKQAEVMGLDIHVLTLENTMAMEQHLAVPWQEYVEYLGGHTNLPRTQRATGVARLIEQESIASPSTPARPVALL